MAEESQQRAEQDVTAATEGYGGPVSDAELADVYLPEGQDAVQDTGSEPAPSTGEASEPDAAPGDTGTVDAASGEPAVEPPD